MEETLGKRIAAGRKLLGITQDRLAEQLGVTAQAVSKWENDQSCPDITMLPKLAEIFGTTTDALLGLTKTAPQEVLEAEVVTAESDSEPGHKWEVRWDAGRKGSIGLAVWIILTAGWMFAVRQWQADISFWNLLWTNGLIVFGLFGLFPKFSFLRLGCALFGTYFLLDGLDAVPTYLGRDLLLPAVLLLFGLSLLMDAIRKPKKPHFSIVHNGKTVSDSVYESNIGEDTFSIDTAFSEKSQVIDLSYLRYGEVDISFGHMTLDLTQIGVFSPDCTIDADCSFGELTILVPRHIRVEADQDTTFGAVNIQGSHGPDPDASIRIDADVSFGQIIIQYV